MTYYDEIRQNVVSGEVDQITELIRRALDEGADPQQIIDRSLVTGMTLVGNAYQAGDMFIPEVLWAAEAMTLAMAVLEPLIMRKGTRSSAKGKVLMGTVQGDEHSIGKQLVSVMLRSGGFDVIDLGVDVPKERFLAAINEHAPNVVGLSALLTTTMPAMRDTVAFLNATELRDAYKIVVGGALVTRAYAEEISADGYAPDAGSSVAMLNELLDLG